MREQSAADDTKRNSSGSETASCDICTWRKLSAAKFCLQCRTSFCEVHLEPHRRVAGLRRHTLIHPAEDPQDRMCPEHHVLLDWFCRTDQACVCHLCLEKDHDTHNACLLEMECGERQAQLRRTHFKVGLGRFFYLAIGLWKGDGSIFISILDYVVDHSTYFFLCLRISSIRYNYKSKSVNGVKLFCADLSASNNQVFLIELMNNNGFLKTHLYLLI